ncbi:MAG TPA: cytochrome D1 domain-containing protein [Terracidiphilus sp.]|nr:cytochrome D1 domain-containing protein [Terracidiphilus sp.]
MKNLIALAGCVAVVSMIAGQGSAQGAKLLVAQKGDRALAIVDAGTGKVLASVPENGVTGHEVAGSPDGKLAFVPIYGNSGVGKPGTDGRNIIVVDLASHKIVGNIEFDHGVRPHCPVFGPDGTLYVTTELDKTVTIIDPKTFKIVGTLPTGQEQSHMFTISHDGLRGYTANVGPGTVSVIDIKARKVLKVIPISGNTQRISITPDGKWVFTADQTKPQMAVVDTAALAVKTWVPIDGLGYGSAVTPNGHYMMVAVPDANKVDVIDVSTMKMVQSIPVGANPQEVLIAPNGKTAYVSCLGSDRVDAIDIATWKVNGQIATGKGTDGLGWARGE